jgi:hypothetical protein
VDERDAAHLLDRLRLVPEGVPGADDELRVDALQLGAPVSDHAIDAALDRP